MRLISSVCLSSRLYGLDLLVLTFLWQEEVPSRFSPGSYTTGPSRSFLVVFESLLGLFETFLGLVFSVGLLFEYLLDDFLFVPLVGFWMSFFTLPFGVCLFSFLICFSLLIHPRKFSIFAICAHFSLITWRYIGLIFL